MTEALATVDIVDKKKTIKKCSKKKRKLIVDTYRQNQGSILDLAKITGISRSRVYEIFDDYPEIREEIDAIDEKECEDRKKKAVSKLDDNVDDGLQRAIEYTLDKEPRRHRGKIVVNKEDQIGGGNVQVNLIFKEIDKRDTAEKTQVST